MLEALKLSAVLMQSESESFFKVTEKNIFDTLLICKKYRVGTSNLLGLFDNKSTLVKNKSKMLALSILIKKGHFSMPERMQKMQKESNHGIY